MQIPANQGREARLDDLKAHENCGLESCCGKQEPSKCPRVCQRSNFEVSKRSPLALFQTLKSAGTNEGGDRRDGIGRDLGRNLKKPHVASVRGAVNGSSAGRNASGQ